MKENNEANMRITVEELTTMWRAAANDMRLDATNLEANARAEQLDACALDLENTKFHHDLVIDPESKRKWWKII